GAEPASPATAYHFFSIFVDGRQPRMRVFLGPYGFLSREVAERKPKNERASRGFALLRVFVSLWSFSAAFTTKTRRHKESSVCQTLCRPRRRNRIRANMSIASQTG